MSSNQIYGRDVVPNKPVIIQFLCAVTHVEGSSLPVVRLDIDTDSGSDLLAALTAELHDSRLKDSCTGREAQV